MALGFGGHELSKMDFELIEESLSLSLILGYLEHGQAATKAVTAVW